MALRVYFDTNTLRDLRTPAERGLPVNPLPAVQRAISKHRFVFVLGSTVILETLPALKSSAEVLQEDLQHISSLLSAHRMVKPPEILLRDAVQSYAHDRRPPDPYTRITPVFTRFMRTGKPTREFVTWVNEITELHGRFPQRMNPAFESARTLGRERHIGRPKTFAELWTPTRPPVQRVSANTTAYRGDV